MTALISSGLCPNFHTDSAGNEYSSEAVKCEAEGFRQEEADVPTDFDGLVRYMGYGYPKRLRDAIGLGKSFRTVTERLVAAGISFRDNAKVLARAYCADLCRPSTQSANRDILRYFERYSKYVPFSGCWVWTGALTTGYGTAYIPAKGHVLLHRFAYEVLRGPIPSGLCLDHLCRVRNCWNPDHLEPVTNKENLLRGVGCSAINAAKTHCLRGHEYTTDNTAIQQHKRGPRRICKTCRSTRYRRERATAVALEAAE